jgi:hypothetical protein
MSERGLPTVDTAPACPFVAFEDDRETRATSPDHRHRCYAELVPSPRAAAHQEAYCLSSAFPVCPTFQDWARREAAHARGEGERPRAAPMAQPDTESDADRDLPYAPAEARVDDREDRADRDRDRADRADSRVDPDRAGSRGDDDRPPRHALPADEPPIRRNPPRDWAAPPPWAPGGAGQGSGGARRVGSPERNETPGFLAGRQDESRGLAGSAADRLADRTAGGGHDDDAGARAFDGASSTDPDHELAGLVSARRPVERPDRDYLPPSRPGRRPTVSSTRSASRDRERERDAIVGPSWEHSRRYEAYPAIRSRAGLPNPPRLAVLAGALVIAAVALFFLPALLGVGGGGNNSTTTPSPNPSQAVASPSAEPATPAPPSAQVYLVEAGDTMSKIASRFGLTLAELCEANKVNIPNCDKIAIGDEITIPARAPEEFTEPSASPS